MLLPLQNTDGSFAWSTDNEHLFYITIDAVLRPDKVFLCFTYVLQFQRESLAVIASFTADQNRQACYPLLVLLGFSNQAKHAMKSVEMVRRGCRSCFPLLDTW